MTPSAASPPTSPPPGLELRGTRPRHRPSLLRPRVPVDRAAGSPPGPGTASSGFASLRRPRVRHGRRSSARRRPHRRGTADLPRDSASTSRVVCSAPTSGRSRASWWKSGSATPPAVTPRRRSASRSTRPALSRCGRCLTDAEGGYRFITIRPGAYPWGNHRNAWRPAHVHFSVFGRTFAERLITQMYFPGDPLLDFDPIFQAVRDPRRETGWSRASTGPRQNRKWPSGTALTSSSEATWPPH